MDLVAGVAIVGTVVGSGLAAANSGGGGAVVAGRGATGVGMAEGGKGGDGETAVMEPRDPSAPGSASETPQNRQNCADGSAAP